MADQAKVDRLTQKKAVLGARLEQLRVDAERVAAKRLAVQEQLVAIDRELEAAKA